jgi:UDP-N-acetylmuramyl pentapeptide phosphotransferase/UDP-N-acetylglucosamine-1-phosphate transferase
MTIEAIIKYPIMACAGLLMAWITTPLWVRWAPRWGFIDQPGGRKIHRAPIPVGGGIAVFFGFHTACAILFLLPWEPFAGQVEAAWWHRFLPLSAAVLVLGLLDDRWNLRPAVKLTGQLLLAGAAYLLDIRLQNVLGFTLPPWADFVGTLAWFVLLMNSFNLIDGIDGLAAGIGVIASLAMALSLLFRHSPGDVLLFVGLAGACLGFLRYNFYPATVFLGDTGSLFIGFTLAALAISTNSKGPAMAAIGMPLLAVGVPLFDTLLAVWRRSVRHLLHDEGTGGRAGVVEGDAEHLHHRLLRGQRTQGRVALLLYALTAFLAAIGILVSVFHDRAMGILALTFLLCAFTVIRHLAWIELRESGRVVLQGIARPVRRNRTLLIYIFGDLILLNLSLLTARVLLDLQDGSLETPLKAYWLRVAPIDVMIPFVCLLALRAYSRVWYLARISEYVTAGLAVILGCLLACSFQLLMPRVAMEHWSRIVFYVLYGGLAAPAIVGIRAAVRVIQDVMQWRARESAADHAPCARALVCGAGYRATLFLRQIAFSYQGQTPTRVLGLVDRDDAIRGHYVHGIQVLGGYRDLPALVKKYRIDTLYMVEPLLPEEEAALTGLVQTCPVKVRRWDIVESTVFAGPGSGADCAQGADQPVERASLPGK